MNDLALKLLAIGLSFSVFFQCYLIKRKVGTYLFPPCIFSMAWFVFTICPLIFLWQIPVNPLGMAYILICTLVFSLSALPFNWAKAYKLNSKKCKNDLKVFDTKFLKYCFFISIALAILFAMLAAIENGFSLQKMIFSVMETSNDYARKRIWGKIEYTSLGKLSTMFVYSAAAMGGFIYYLESNRYYKNIFLAISFLPALYVMLTQSSKVVLFISLSYFIGSNVLMKLQSNQLKLFDKKILIKFLIYGLILIVPIIISVISRGNDLLIGVSALDLLLHSFNSYLLGSFFAFSDFFASYLGFDSLVEYAHNVNYWGRYTFKPLFDAIDMGAVFPVGIFSEQYKITGLINTNIYTIFRGLIYDYGLFGSVVFIFISGLIINSAFYKLLCDKENFFLSIIFITSIVFIFFADLMSLFMARYTLPVFVLLYVILKLNRHFYQIDRLNSPQDGK